jgi:hypothetical protein
VIPGADLVIDAETRLHHALAAIELFGVLGTNTALARQHAFAVGDDHFETALGRAHRLFQGFRHLRNAVATHRAQPSDAERAQRFLDGDAGWSAAAVRRA